MKAYQPINSFAKKVDIVSDGGKKLLYIHTEKVALCVTHTGFMIEIDAWRIDNKPDATLDEILGEYKSAEYSYKTPVAELAGHVAQAFDKCHQYTQRQTE